MNLFGQLGLEVESDIVVGIFEDIRDFINTLFTVFIIIVMLAAVFYAIYLGYRLARAEDEVKRKEAKQQLLWALIGALAAGVVFALFTTIIEDQVTGLKDKYTLDETGDVAVLANGVLTIIYLCIDVIARLFSIAATVFCVYLIFRFVKAEDEGKRKECKKQLLWTFIAILGVMVVIALLPAIMGAIIGGEELEKITNQ
jgi:cytochrome bd-type quinol oxidase subunit 2